MLNIFKPFSFARRRLEATSPPDIITLPWTQYHEQGRGVGTDYAPAGSPSWVGLATAGPSAGRDLIPFGSGPWGLPIVGGAIGTTNTVRFNDDLDDLKSQLTATNFVAVNEFTLALLVKIDATVQPFANNACLVYMPRLRLICGQVGGLAKCKLHTVNTIDNFAESTTFALGSWVSIFARFAGGSLDFRINKVNSTPITGVADIGAGLSGETPRVANQTTGVAIHDRLASALINVRLTDAQCDLAHNSWKYRHPAAGLP